MAKIREIQDYLKFANYGANFNLREKLADKLLESLSKFYKVDSREDVSASKSDIIEIAEREHKMLPKDLKGAAYAKNNIIEDMKTEILQHSSHYTFITYLLLWKMRKMTASKNSNRLHDQYKANTLSSHIIKIVENVHKCDASALEQLYYMEFDLRAISIEAILLCFQMAFDVYCLEANGIYWRTQYIYHTEEKKNIEKILSAATEKAKEIEQKMKSNTDPVIGKSIRTELLDTIKDMLTIKKSITHIDEQLNIADQMTQKLSETIYISNLMMLKSHTLLYHACLLQRYYKPLVQSLKLRKNRNEYDLLISKCYAEELIDELNYIYYMCQLFSRLLNKEFHNVELD
jgi:hypothetical protein